MAGAVATVATEQTLQDILALLQDAASAPAGTLTVAAGAASVATDETLRAIKESLARIGLLDTGNAGFVTTFADFAGAAIPAIVQVVSTLGYYAAGDGGGCSYVRMPIGGGNSSTTGTALWRATDALGNTWEPEVLMPAIDQFGASGNVTTFDSQPAIQACLDWLTAAGGGIFTCRKPYYYLANKVVYDPVRIGGQGNGAAWQWTLKTFYDVNAQPELLGNSSFTSAGSNWIVASNSVASIVFNSSGTGTATVTQNTGEAKYASFGQKITAPAGATIQIIATVNYIANAQTTAGDLQNTMTFLLGNSAAADGTPKTIDNMGIVAGQSSSYKRTQSDYAEPNTITILLQTLTANPFLRIDCNASWQLDLVSAKVVPDNQCLVLTSTHEQYNHNRRSLSNLALQALGVGDSGKAYADVVTLSSTTPQSSRAFFNNLDIIGGARGIVFGTATYLCDIRDCRIAGSVASVDTIDNPNNYDAGENINFYTVTFGGAPIRNRGMAFTYHGCSNDFPSQWFVGKGRNTLYGLWFEKGQATAGKYNIDLQAGGQFIAYGGCLQGDGYDPANTSALDAPFRIAAGATMILHEVDVSGLPGTSGQIFTGDGNFISRGMLGGSGMSAITQRRVDLNKFGDGVLDSGTAKATFTASATSGSAVLTSVSSVASVAVGDVLQNAGFFPKGTTVAAVDGTAMTVTASTTAITSGAAQTFTTWRIAAAPGVNCWVTSSGSGAAHAQPDRYSLQWFNRGTFTGTTSLLNAGVNTEGSAYISNIVPGAAGLPPAQGAYITGNDGSIPPNTVGVASNNTTTISGGIPAKTVVLSADVIKQNTSTSSPTTFTWTMPTPTSTSGLAISTANFRSGAASMRFYKSSGIGNGNPVAFWLTMPIEQISRHALELYYSVTANAGAAAGSKASFFIDSYYLHLANVGATTPYIARQDYSGYDATQQIDLQTGKLILPDSSLSPDTWNRVYLNGLYYTTGSNSGYPPEWATHVGLLFNMVAVPGGFEMHMDDFFGNLL